MLRNRRLRQALTALALAGWPTVQAAAGQDPPSEESIRFFKLNCTSCHTLGGGRLTGPDLLRDSRGVYMTPVPGMTRELAGKLLDLIAAESLLEESQFAGLELSDRPLTDADIARGRELFEGTQKIASGSPACVSCHSVAGLGAFGGGRLGPDLTSAYGRLEGRKALGAWLASPPSAVMQPLFLTPPLESEKILALIAFLKHSAESGVTEARSRVLEFVLSGIGLAALLMVLFDDLWRGSAEGLAVSRLRAQASIRTPGTRRLQPCGVHTGRVPTTTKRSSSGAAGSRLKSRAARTSSKPAAE